MNGLALHLSDDQLDQLADVLTPRVLARLGSIEPDPPAPVAYTIASLAADLGVTEKVVRGAIHRNELPAQRRGRRYLIDPDAAREWARPAVAAVHPRRTSVRRGADRPLREALAQLDQSTNGGTTR